MKCPECGLNSVKPNIIAEIEVAEYACKECHTEWHLHFGEPVGDDGMFRVVVQEESTWLWKVCFETDPSFIPDAFAPGKKAAIDAMLAFIKRGLEWDKIGDSTILEFSVGADPQHPASDGPGMNIWVNIEVTSAEYTPSVEEQQAAESALLKIESELE